MECENILKSLSAVFVFGLKSVKNAAPWLSVVVLVSLGYGHLIECLIGPWATSAIN